MVPLTEAECRRRLTEWFAKRDISLQGTFQGDREFWIDFPAHRMENAPVGGALGALAAIAGFLAPLPGRVRCRIEGGSGHGCRVGIYLSAPWPGVVFLSLLWFAAAGLFVTAMLELWQVNGSVHYLVLTLSGAGFFGLPCAVVALLLQPRDLFSRLRFPLLRALRLFGAGRTLDR